ncbi:uncharacterized protein METZ01_LOCUS281529, partial [marine metagenome]
QFRYFQWICNIIEPFNGYDRSNEFTKSFDHL